MKALLIHRRGAKFKEDQATNETYPRGYSFFRNAGVKYIGDQQFNCVDHAGDNRI